MILPEPPAHPPALEVRPLEVTATKLAGRWRVTWRVACRGSVPVALDAVWLPHGRFRASETVLDPALAIAPGEVVTLPTEVAWEGRPGEAVENCFVILRVRVGDRAWRVLTRLTIVGGPVGEPRPEPRLTTVQRVGFSAPEIQ